MEARRVEENIQTVPETVTAVSGEQLRTQNIQTPADLDTITDLQKLPDLLRRRDYPEADIAAIMHGNWLRFFSETLPN